MKPGFPAYLEIIAKLFNPSRLTRTEVVEAVDAVGTVDAVAAVAVPPGNDIVKSLVSLIAIEHIDDFTSWRKIVWALQKLGYDKDYVCEVSMRSMPDSIISGIANRGTSHLTLGRCIIMRA